MTHYDKGTRFEHKVRKALIADGYTVIRSAGSKGDHKIDLSAMKPGDQLFIQCKSDGAISPAEWDRIFEVASWYPTARAILAANGPQGRGVVYTELLGPKRRGCRAQPTRPFVLDQVAATFDDINPYEED